MGAFDGKNKVPRAVADPLTDHKLPGSKSLSWKAISTPEALAGTIGSHCELVHGDQWNELKGNQTENITRNQTIKVVGKHKETLVESCYQNIIGPHIVQNNNVRNETRLGTFSKVYGENWTHEHDWGEVSQMDQNYSNVWDVQMSNAGTSFEHQILHVEATEVHGELAVVHGEAKALHAELKGLHFELDGYDNKDAAADADLKMTRNQIAEIYDDVVILFNRTGGPELHTGPSIFAAITGTGLIVP